VEKIYTIHLYAFTTNPNLHTIIVSGDKKDADDPSVHNSKSSVPPFLLNACLKKAVMTINVPFGETTWGEITNLKKGTGMSKNLYKCVL
jgi:hypothetical protein